MTIEAMKLALDALEFLELEIFVELDKSLNVGPTHGRKAIIALRAAIEQAEKPRQWQGLTEEEKAELDAEYGDDTLAHLDAIEAKLREKNI
jgi:hypothetical protein